MNNGYFEFLGSCSEDETTRSAGPHSFTTALIWALKELAKESKAFDTSKLRHKIKQYDDFPKEQVPCLIDREQPGGHIVIDRQNLSRAVTRPAPSRLEKERAMQYKESFEVAFHFDHIVSAEMIARVADELVPLRDNKRLRISRIEFSGKRSLFSKAVGTMLARQRGLSAVISPDRDPMRVTLPSDSSPDTARIKHQSPQSLQLITSGLGATSRSSSLVVEAAGHQARIRLDDNETLTYHIAAIGSLLVNATRRTQQWLRIMVSDPIYTCSERSPLMLRSIEVTNHG